MTVSIAHTSKINEGRHSRNPDCGINKTFAPDAAKSVRYDDSTSEDTSKLASGTIGIFGKNAYNTVPFNVRLIYTGVSTNKAVMCFADQNLAAHPNDSARFAEDNLHQPRIFFHASAESNTVLRRLHGRQLNDSSLSLRDYLLRNSDDVARLNLKFRHPD